MSDRKSATAHTPRLRGWHVLAVFLGFFATVFVVDGFMIYKAVSTFGGIETQDAYRRGLAYNERIAAGAEQERLGWSDELSFVAEGERVRVALADKNGVPVEGVALTASIGRPATDRFDRQLAFTQTGSGTYEAQAADLQPGWWTVELQANSAASDAPLFASRQRLWIKP